MLRRFIACLTLSSMLFVSLSPLATLAAPSAGQSGQQGGARRKLAPELESSTAGETLQRVIVQTKGRPTATHEAAITDRRGMKRRGYEALNALVAEVPAS